MWESECRTLSVPRHHAAGSGLHFRGTGDAVCANAGSGCGNDGFGRANGLSECAIAGMGCADGRAVIGTARHVSVGIAKLSQRAVLDTLITPDHLKWGSCEYKNDCAL